MSIYWIIVIVVLLFGALMPQTGSRRIHYIIIMGLLHTFVCGFKYMYLTGDLMSYAWNYYEFRVIPFLSPSVLEGGRNALWNVFMQIVSKLSKGNYQFFLIVHAAITEFCLAHFVYRHSPRPWFSYLVWNCMSFYLYGFNAMKQMLAMSVCLIAAEGILENNRKKFYFFSVIAGLIHAPAFSFLPAFWLSKRKLSKGFAVLLATIVFLMYTFRVPIVDFMTSIYYENIELTDVDLVIGGRFIVVLIILAAGFLLRGFENEKFKKLFIIICFAAVIQIYSGYNNVFTRFSDYFLQLTVIYFPMLFYDDREEQLKYYSDTGTASRIKPAIILSPSINQLAVWAMSAVLIWWYYMAELRFASDVHNYLFMWQA